MNEIITFSGLSLTPDEFNVNNGEMAICAGLENHDGGMRPVQLEGTLTTYPLEITSGQPCDLLFVHETPGDERRFIAKDANNKVVWFHADGSHENLPTIVELGQNTIKSVQSVGNTVIIAASNGLHYALWKNDTYKYLGQKPPFLKLAFTLAGDLTARDATDFKAKYDQSTLTEVTGDETEYYDAWRQTALNTGDSLSLKNNNSTVAIKAEVQATVTEAAWALLNETNSVVAKQGHFYAPFFVRYCYRLYDGSMYMHSAPVFMQTTMPQPFTVYLANCYSESNAIHINTGEVEVQDTARTPTFKFNKLTLLYTPSNVELQYKLENTGVLTQLQDNWSDIVKSVDIFVTPPITPYNTAEKITSAVIEQQRQFFPPAVVADSNFQYRLIKTRVSSVDVQKTTILSREAKYVSRSGSKAINVALDIPATSYQTFTEKIMNQSAFFRLKSLSIQGSFSADYDTLDVDASAVQNIAAQTLMVDDYKSHNTITPEGTFVYNRRLHLYGGAETLFEGFDVNQLAAPLQEGILSDDKGKTIDKVSVVLQTEQGEKTVIMNHSGGAYDTTMATYLFTHAPLFYPDARAKKMIFQVSKNGDTKIYEKEMHPLNEINGAMTKPGNFYRGSDWTEVDSFPQTAQDTVMLPNKIYESEVNNPFYFPVDGINTVGLGTILGLTTTTRALSSGTQFGTWPLVAFATDGIWALELAVPGQEATGYYLKTHNISRLVCSNPKSIAQLDQTAVFATSRALYMLAESQTKTITDALDGPYNGLPTEMTEITTVINSLPQEAAAALNLMVASATPPITQFQTASILYDYTSSRLIVTTPASNTPTVAWVYALANGTWSTMLMPARRNTVNSYPCPFIQTADGKVMCLDKKYDYTKNTTTPGFILTRTLKLKGVIKTITGLQLMASTDAEHTPTTFLYGSNDNIHWNYMGHASRLRSGFIPGHAWRYFRLAFITNMKADEQLVAQQLNYIEKYTNF